MASQTRFCPYDRQYFISVLEKNSIFCKWAVAQRLRNGNHEGRLLFLQSNWNCPLSRHKCLIGSYRERQIEQPVPCSWGTCSARRAWRKIWHLQCLRDIGWPGAPTFCCPGGFLACVTGECHVHVAALNDEYCSSGTAAELLCPVTLLTAWGRSGKLDLEKKQYVN